MQINKQGFLSSVFSPTLYTPLANSTTLLPQAELGISAIIDEFESRQLTDLRWLAYILATAYHETGKTIQPIEEDGRGRGRKYGNNIKFDGTMYTTPDKIYYGRGVTQNTWYEIYDMLTKDAAKEDKNWDFLNKPELLLTMECSIWATFHCMIHGKYTGVGLPRYFNNAVTDWINARRIINGLDKAVVISEYAATFYNCLKDNSVSHIA